MEAIAGTVVGTVVGTGAVEVVAFKGAAREIAPRIEKKGV